jgi:hypothetical protein
MLVNLTKVVPYLKLSNHSTFKLIVEGRVHPSTPIDLGKEMEGLMSLGGNDVVAIPFRFTGRFDRRTFFFLKVDLKDNYTPVDE